jgi:hypothetical protein
MTLKILFQELGLVLLKILTQLLQYPKRLIINMQLGLTRAELKIVKRQLKVSKQEKKPRITNIGLKRNSVPGKRGRSLSQRSSTGIRTR